MTTPEPTPSARVALICRPTFDVVKRGFDRQQVLDYSARVVDMVQDLEKQLHLVRSEAEEAARRPDDLTGGQDGVAGNVEAEADPYQAMSSHVAEVLRAMDRDVEARRQEVETQAESRRRQAETEAGGIVHAAKAEADRILDDARAAVAEERAAATENMQRADAAAAEIGMRRAGALRELTQLRDLLFDTIQELEKVKVLGERPQEIRLDDAVGSEPSPATGENAGGDGPRDNNGNGQTRSDDVSVVKVPTLQPVPEMPAGSVWSAEGNKE